MYNFGYCCNLITAFSFYFKGPYSYSIKKKNTLLVSGHACNKIPSALKGEIFYNY